MYVLYVRARKETGSAQGNQERESTSAKKLVARKRGSAKAKARNLRPKKERKSASAKGFRREREDEKKARAQLWCVHMGSTQ